MNNKKYFLALTFFSLSLVCFSAPAYASSFSVQAEDWPHAIMGLFGGIAFLLYGLGKLTNAFKALAGDNLRILLDNFTKNSFKGLLTGGLVTAVVQSSAAVTVMVVGFVSAKLLTLSRALPIIIGADIGTTITVQLIAFKFNQYALVLIAFGYFIKSFSKQESVWHIGRALMALGMVFFGIFIMSESMAIVKEDPFLVQTMTHLSNPLLGIIVGFVATALMQSSAAAIAVIMAFASQGLISLSGGLFLVMGANVGTCILAILASFKTDTDGQRTALAHIIFKVGTTIVISGIAIIVGQPFFEFLLKLDPASTLENIDARHIAHLHTAFNICIAVLFMPILPWFVILLRKLIKRGKESAELQSRYLDDALLSTPSLALNAARIELVRIGRIVGKGLRLTPKILFTGNIDQLNRLRRKEKRVDVLYKKVLDYLASLSKEELSAKESRELAYLLNIANRVENVADLIGLELYELGRRRHKRSVKVSAKTTRLIEELFEITHINFTDVNQTLNGKKPSESVVDSEQFQLKVNDVLTHQASRLKVQEGNRVNTYALEVEMVDKIHRIFHHTRQLRKIMLERIGDEATVE